jgi:exodeoxyribonuclease-5
MKKVLQKEFEQANAPKFSLKETIGDIDLIIIDEVSMVSEAMGNDLLSFDKKILVLGDPAQLPPIEGAGFFTSQEPDVLLTEIHRQAQGNPIIAMATLVRQGHRLKKGSYGSSQCIDRRLDNRDPRDFEQLIVGTNRTRKTWNTRYRDLLGFMSSSPEQGEKVICLKNNKEKGLLNGTQWRVKQGEDRGYAVAMELFPWDDPYDPSKEGLIVEAHQFDTDYKALQWYERARAEEFDFGYAITCHKSQGSQWKSGYIADESFIFRENSNKWLYTALTRFEDKVVVAL